MYKLLFEIADWWYMREFITVRGWWWRKVVRPLEKKVWDD